MDTITAIFKAAKIVKISGTLLLAICLHESGGLKYNYAPNDRGTPSIGSCQVKYDTARQMGFHGKPEDLMDAKTNALYAARYLKYQESRYGDNWLKLTAAYNSGSYRESTILPGCPRNLHYVRSVQSKLPEEFRDRLDCGDSRVAEND